MRNWKIFKEENKKFEIIQWENFQKNERIENFLEKNRVSKIFKEEEQKFENFQKRNSDEKFENSERGNYEIIKFSARKMSV